MSSAKDILDWANENARADDDWDGEADTYPAAVRLWSASPKGVLYGTKPHCLWKMLPDLAPGYSTYTKYFPAPQWLADLVALDPAAREHLIFVGDLDPLDLLALATLIERAKLDPECVYFAGPVDPWLAALSDEHRQIISVAMSDFEVKLWAHVRNLEVDWEAYLGPHALALLNGGHKIELDGAMNPEIYGEAFTRWAGARILDRWA